MQDILQSKPFKIIILGIGAFAVLVLVFSVGIFVGAEKADFSCKWTASYHRDFGGPPMGISGFMGTNNAFMNSNGSFGQIIQINGNIITVKDNDGDETEKTILVGNKTIITYQRKNIKLTDLTLNDEIVVVGQPNSSGEIQAEFIRLMPRVPQDTNLPLNLVLPSVPATSSVPATNS